MDQEMIDSLPAVRNTHNIVVDITDDIQMGKIERFASNMASGETAIPDHLRGKLPDCMAIAMQAVQWGMNPYEVARKTYFIKGTISYEAQLVNAVITSSTAIDGRFHYRYSDGPWIVNNKKHEDPCDWVQVGAVLSGESEIQWGEKLYPAHVATKNSPLWNQSGAGVKQQSSYLALQYWSRLYTPEVIQGVYTPEELSEVRETKVINPTESALNIPSNAKAEVVDTGTGEAIQANTETGEVLPGFDDIMQDMVAAQTIDQLKLAAQPVINRQSSVIEGSEDHDELSGFYQGKMKKLKIDLADPEISNK